MKRIRTTVLVAGFCASSAMAQPAVDGRWDPWTGQVWNFFSVHALHMPTASILFWSIDAGPIGGETAQLFDPFVKANNFTDVFVSDEIACAGHAGLADGSFLVAGGIGHSAYTATRRFNGAWSALDDMNFERFYPTLTTLGDGRILVMGGGANTVACGVDVREIFDIDADADGNNDGEWSIVNDSGLPACVLGCVTGCPPEGIPAPVGWYPHAFLLPDGNVAVVAANQRTQEGISVPVSKDTWILEFQVEGAVWSLVDTSTFSGEFGSSAMYEPGHALKCGGVSAGLNSLAVPETAIIDFNATNPTWTTGAGMQLIHRRKEHNLVLLPDGHVLALGGRENGPEGDESHVYHAEWIDPTEASPAWEELAEMNLGRDHHSTAMLLRNATVLIAGENETEEDTEPDRNGETFLPPYLFQGNPRPVIDSAPGSISYGSLFTILLCDLASPTAPVHAEDIDRVVLLRLGATTHNFDQNQRRMTLAHTVADECTLSVTMPFNSNLAPAGAYMLFIVSDAGVPSKAVYVNL